MGLLNKLWSGLDFWDKKENQGQRTSYAQQDEEDKRRRQQQQAARVSVSQPGAQSESQPQFNTPGITPTNTTPKPLQIGSQSNFAQTAKTPGQLFNPNQPLQKVAATGVQPPKPAQPAATPIQPQPLPTTPKPQVPHPPTLPPNPVDVRQKAAAYQNPNVQDVNNHYGSDLKVLNEELAKGDNSDLHRVQSLMQSLDARKKELKDFHDARANTQSFKSARQLGDTIKNTRGDWHGQNQKLKDFWDGVSHNQTGDFEQYLTEKGVKSDPSNPLALMARQGVWKNGNGQNFTPDFTGDHQKVEEVQQRQKVADVMTSDKLRDVPLAALPGSKTTVMHLRDFKSASPEDQARQLSELEAIIRDNEHNYSASPELKKKADQAFMLQQTLLDSGAQKQDWHTRLDSVGQAVGKFGDAAMSSPKRYAQSVDALSREVAGAPQRGEELTKLHDMGHISDEEYNRKLNENTRDTGWAGDGSQGRGHDLLVAAGTSADIVSTFLPVLFAAKGAQGALTAEKMAGQIAAEQGISRQAARIAAKETLTAFAEGSAKNSLKQTMAKEALANAGFSGVGSLRDGTFDPGKAATETVVGGVIGGVAPVVGDVLGKVGSKVLSKFGKSVEADLPSSVEDLGRIGSNLEGGAADVTARASYMSAEQSARIDQLSQIVDDPNIPSYQKIGAHNELTQLEKEVDNKMADAVGGGDTAIDTTPAYEHRNQIQKIIDDGEFQLQERLSQIPDPTPAQIEEATQAVKANVVAQTDALKANRFPDLNTPVNIPDPTSPITLAKAGNELVPTADDVILPDTFNPAPLQKVRADSPAATAEAPLQTIDAPVVDAQGNAALITDAEHTQRLAADGVIPPVGASPVARAEDQMANAAEEATRNQVDLANPTTGVEASNRTAERVLADPNIPQDTKDAISNLTHATHSDSIMINSAQGLVKNDINTARQVFDNSELITNGLNLDGHVHLGNALTDEYNRLGQTAEAAAVYNDLISTTTRLGQGLRAASAISKISPQGIVDFAAKVASKNGKALSPELEQELIQTATEVSKMADGVEKASAIQRMIEMAQQPTWKDKLGNFVKGVLSTPRGIMATGDLSFAIRQGGVLGSRYPAEWAAAVKNSAKYAVSDESFQKGMTDLANLKDVNGDYLGNVFKKMDLSLNAVTGKSEEVFGNTSVLESKALKKVGIGHVVAASDRAFSGAAADLRANVAKKIIDGYGGVKAMENWDDKALKDLGRVLNTSTGRGVGSEANFVGRGFEKAAPFFSDTLFSARLWKSRLDLLNPVYYATLSPAARKVALQSSSSFAAVVSATLAAGAAAGATVETNPLSSDFGKMKFGNTRYDVMGGLQQNIVLAARQIMGEKKTSDGSTIDLTEGGYGKPNRFTVLSDFVTNKETPVLATATRLLKGTGIDGKPVNPWTEVAKLFIPLGLMDTNSLIQSNAGNGDASATPGQTAKNLTDPKGVATAMAQASPSFFGVGVQTYGGGTKQIAADSGVDPTTLDPKQLKKYKDNVNKDFVKGLSEAEQHAYNLSKDSKLEKVALDKGSIKQGQIDAVLQKENQALQKAGLPTHETKLASKESIQARVENGEYDKAIGAIDKQIRANEKNKDIPKSKTEELKIDKKRLQVTMDGHYTPDIIKAYSSTSLAEWRTMTDPDSDMYDPEKAGLLMQYDKQLTDSGVSKGKDLDKVKYYAKAGRGGKGGKGGRGGRGSGDGSDSVKLSMDIATNKVSFDGFTPQKAQSASSTGQQSPIPTLQKVPNYSRVLKKISVSK